MTHAAAFALDQGVADHARAGHAVRMADGDGAAVDVQPLVGNAQPVLAIEHLHGEGLVELPQADIVHGQVEPLQQFRHSEDRPDTHLIGLGAGDRHADIAAQWRQAAAFGGLRFHDHAGRGAVRQLAGIACGHCPFRHDHPQRRQTFRCGVGAIALVALEPDLAQAGLARRLVDQLHRRGDRHDLGVEAAGQLGGGGTLL